MNRFLIFWFPKKNCVDEFKNHVSMQMTTVKCTIFQQKKPRLIFVPEIGGVFGNSGKRWTHQGIKQNCQKKKNHKNPTRKRPCWLRKSIKNPAHDRKGWCPWTAVTRRQCAFDLQAELALLWPFCPALGPENENYMKVFASLPPEQTLAQTNTVSTSVSADS